MALFLRAEHGDDPRDIYCVKSEAFKHGMFTPVSSVVRRRRLLCESEVFSLGITLPGATVLKDEFDRLEVSVGFVGTLHVEAHPVLRNG